VFKRLFWLVVGFLLGLGSSYALTRRLRRLAARYAPAEVVDRWGGTVRAAVDEGRTAMRNREAQLRAEGKWRPRPEGRGRPERPVNAGLTRGVGQ
jgi:hypothetical protein